MPNQTNGITNELRRFVIDNFLFGNADSFTNDASFFDSGIIDSTGVLELVGFLERHYSIKLEDEELVPDNLDSVRNLTCLVERKLSEQLKEEACRSR